MFLMCAARQQCNVELLLNGRFHPLTGFLVEADYTRVLSQMRLSIGDLWPILITLDIPTEFAVSLQLDQSFILKDSQQSASLEQQQTQAGCGLQVIDIKTRDIRHWLMIEGYADEIYDIAVLLNIRQPHVKEIEGAEVRSQVVLASEGVGI